MDCSICGHPIESEAGWDQGHNAEPITEGRCCNWCNTNVVIPVRIRRKPNKPVGIFASPHARRDALQKLDQLREILSEDFARTIYVPHTSVLVGTCWKEERHWMVQFPDRQDGFRTKRIAKKWVEQLIKDGFATPDKADFFNNKSVKI